MDGHTRPHAAAYGFPDECIHDMTCLRQPMSRDGALVKVSTNLGQVMQ